jgi:regulator of cell morphogenesis and NO signaling
MSFDAQTLVADVVLRHPETARVFDRHRIDFCCGGQVPLGDACERAGVDRAGLFTELAAAAAEPAPPRNLTALSTSALIAYIVGRHHEYLRSSIPVLRARVEKVAGVHGERNPKLHGLQTAVNELFYVLEAHLDGEERTLFPALLGPEAGTGSAAALLDSMYADHVEVGEALWRIRALADDYVVPEWGCTTYRVLCSELAELEADIHEHVHLENNVLMPRFAARR